ncbi:MAG: A/G-specific adenine glycosylase [Gammaproteobacteria bacterium]|nr:A/G-specific adenine glycosylase [Gammaproteobacteria bacterium]
MNADWFAQHVLRWFDQNGRKDLPWQADLQPYQVWVSEIMLQQTQVTTVIPFYERFMTRFPTVQALAAAERDEILHHWTGLGYYARARNLHKAAGIVVTDFDGVLPVGVAELSKLPGIGLSTAGAIAAISQGQWAPILDGNVKRVLARFHAVPGYPGTASTLNTLWQLAEQHTPTKRVADYTQAIMDLGATLCARTPDCQACPIKTRCEAHANSATDQYPGRKPKKDKPVRRARMFLIVDTDNACLLEQRPDNGIWGGLWTPPERDADYSIDQLSQEFGIARDDIGATHTAPAFRHTFTHFHLDIEPVRIELTQRPALVRDGADLLWYAAGKNAPVGLAAPAVTLLRSLDEFELT